MYMNLEKKMREELQALEEKYGSGTDMSESDLRRIDLLFHSLKNMAKYKYMKGSEDTQNYGENYNKSYMNNPSYMNNSYGRMDGRYRDMEQSGRYPMNYPMYPEERRW